MNKNKKHKLSKAKKSGIAIGLSLVISMGTFIKIISPSHKNEAESVPPPTVTENIDMKTNNEYEILDYNYNGIKISLSNEDLENFRLLTTKYDTGFSMAKYYCIDRAVEQYQNTEMSKEYNTDLLDGNNKVDETKLYESIIRNNEALKEKGKNSINTFYKDLSPNDIKNLCHTIATVINNICSDSQMPSVATTLSKLTMFQKNGSSSNAYVTNNLTFVYNPSMSSMYSDMQQIKDSTISEEDVKKSIIVHEISHIIQYATGDQNDQNGLEIGFCRMYNLPNTEKKVPIDSLYYDWYLEGTAELKAAKYMNMEPGTYQKKISYINSIDLSRIFSSGEVNIEDLDTTKNIDEVFKKLNLVSEEEQNNFLELMYSIELTQSSADEFWEYYQEQTAQSLSTEEINHLKMQIREDAIINLSNNYYSGLIKSIKDGNIKDLDTLFFMMRTWEADAYNHLQYNNNKDSLRHASRYLLWSDNIQNEIFSMVGRSNNLTQDEVSEMYNTYNMFTEENGQIIANCDLTSFSEQKQSFILNLANSNNTSRFSRVSDAVLYLKNKSKDQSK